MEVEQENGMLQILECDTVRVGFFGLFDQNKKCLSGMWISFYYLYIYIYIDIYAYSQSKSFVGYHSLMKYNQLKFVVYTLMLVGESLLEKVMTCISFFFSFPFSVTLVGSFVFMFWITNVL